ncbi:DUF6542 domain-containing protein [Mycolicibacterium phlei]
MSAQRARSAVAADHRSAHPSIPGVPWWGAVLIAITATAIGFAFDAGSGSKQLSTVFAVCYVLGCVGAVLAVRQAAIFTAVVQPPLVLFASVPTAYLLFTASQIDGIKDLAINCGYPLIERFPLMFFTSAGVLLIGLVRWYIGMTTRHAVPAADDDAQAVAPVDAGPGLLAGVTAKISSLFGAADSDGEPAEPPRRRRPAADRTRDRAQRTARRTRAERAERGERPTRTRTGSTRSGRPAARTTPPRSRHVRPPETEIADPAFERPRRPRPPRQGEPPAEPRRRPRPPRQSGPPPTERRTGYDRNGYERPGYERTGYERPERRRRYDDYEPREPHTRGTHHPVSRVRYRGEENDDRAQYRARRRAPEGRDVDSWQYDI